jgi:hypothetical protein
MSRIGLVLAMLLSLAFPGTVVALAAVSEGTQTTDSQPRRSGDDAPAPEPPADPPPPPVDVPAPAPPPPPPDHDHGVAPIETAFATLANLELWDPERVKDVGCYGEGLRRHWLCEVNTGGRIRRYTIHVNPELGTISWVTPGDSHRALVAGTRSAAIRDGFTHSHGEGSFKVVERTLAELGLDERRYECWAGAERSAHWKCRNEVDEVWTVHITAAGNPKNYVTDGWDPIANIIGVNE